MFHIKQLRQIIKLTKTIECISSRGVKMKTQDNDLIKILQKSMNVPKVKIELFLLKNPHILKLEKEHISSVLEVIKKYDHNLHNCLSEPKIFSQKPITIDYRGMILAECGVQNISVSSLVSFLNLVMRRKISFLKGCGILPSEVNVQRELIKHLSVWPTSPPMLEVEDDSESTIYELRMKVLSRYLELNIDLPPESFKNAILSYSRIKHRPLQVMNQTLNILQGRLGMSDNKIRTNMAVMQCNPDNILHILDDIQSLAGIQIKDIVKQRPTLLTVNYKTIQRIQHLLNDSNISLDAQSRCFEIYTLGYETVKTRLNDLKKEPVFNALMDHPRILRLVFYKNKAESRLALLKEANKVSISLNVLSGCSDHFNAFGSTKGDNVKFTEIAKVISSILTDYSFHQIYAMLQKHPFPGKVSLVNAHVIYGKIKSQFTQEEIFTNLQILLYPWDSIERHLNLILNFHEIVDKVGNNNILKANNLCFLDGMNSENITKCQVLSLVVYLMERDHNYSGDGIWSDTKSFDKNQSKKNDVMKTKIKKKDKLLSIN